MLLKLEFSVLFVVEYVQMLGDFHRYLAEYFPQCAEKSKIWYTKAWELCQKSLEKWHPVRLGLFVSQKQLGWIGVLSGLALNFSIFYHEIEKETKKAHDLSTKA